METLPSPHLTHQVSLLADAAGRNVTPVTSSSFAVNRPSVHLRQEDVSDCLQNGRGSAFQQVREPHQQLALAHPDGVLDAGECEELDLQFGDGGVRAKLTIRFLKNLEKVLPHVGLD